MNTFWLHCNWKDHFKWSHSLINFLKCNQSVLLRVFCLVSNWSFQLSRRVLPWSCSDSLQDVGNKCHDQSPGLPPTTCFCSHFRCFCMFGQWHASQTLTSKRPHPCCNSSVLVVVHLRHIWGHINFVTMYHLDQWVNVRMILVNNN